MSKNDFSSRTAIVFGATGCLGKAISFELAKLNVKLILVGQRKSKLEEIDDNIKEITNLNSTLVPLDISHTKSLEKLSPIIFNKFKKIDILINSASFFPKLSPLNHIPPKDFSKIININIIAAWNIIRIFEPLLNISDAGKAYFMICKKKKYREPYFSPYSITSNGIESLINNWKKEIIKSNLKVCCYDPGPIMSNLRKKSFPGENQDNLVTPKKAAKKFVNKLVQSYLE